MNKLLISSIALVGTFVSASATIYTVDYLGSANANAKVTIGGYDGGNSITQVLYLKESAGQFQLSNSSFTGSTGVYVGAYKFAGLTSRVLCVQLDAYSNPGDYARKSVTGYAGWLTQQIATLTSANTAQAAGLAIATWAINYDSTEYGGAGLTHSPSLSNLTNTSLTFSWVGSTSNAAYTAAVGYINDYYNYKAQHSSTIDYYYYHTPNQWNSSDSQDYIGASDTFHQTDTSTPSPAAVIPFAIGLVASLKRKRA